jgi:hypothetical protein
MFRGGRFCRPFRGAFPGAVPVLLAYGVNLVYQAHYIYRAVCTLAALLFLIGAAVVFLALVYPVNCVLDGFACAGYWGAGGSIAGRGVGAGAGGLGRAVLYIRLKCSGGGATV